MVLSLPFLDYLLLMDIGFLLILFESTMVGKDKCVVLWSVHDHISTLAVEEAPTVKQGSKSGGNNAKATESPTIGPRGIYQGHTDTVEDVQFCPSR